MINVDEIRGEIKLLRKQGVDLVNALQVEVFPQQMELHFVEVLKKDYKAFRESLPDFHTAYQFWYSETQAIIKKFLPLRLNDFINLYEVPKGRKEIKKENYTIDDYLKGVVITAGFDKKVVAGPEDAVTLMQQQLNIFDTVSVRLESTVFQIEEQIQSSILDRMLQQARLLSQNGFGRSAGAICGSILEQHFVLIQQKHQIKIAKKAPSLTDFNKVFQEAELYDFSVGRQVQYMAELRDLCVKNKKVNPTQQQVDDILLGTEKLIKMIA